MADISTNSENFLEEQFLDDIRISSPSPPLSSMKIRRESSTPTPLQQPGSVSIQSSSSYIGSDAFYESTQSTGDTITTPQIPQTQTPDTGIGSDAWIRTQSGEPTPGIPGNVTTSSGPTQESTAGSTGMKKPYGGPARHATGDKNSQPYPNVGDPKPPKNKQSDTQIWGMHPSCYGEPTEAGDEVGQVQAQGYAQSLVVDIYPALPNFASSGDDEKGLQLFSLDLSKGREMWHSILYQLSDYIDDPKPQAPLRLAILNDVSIAEQWSHSFGETSFEGMMNFGSPMLQELKAVTGSTSLRSALTDTMATSKNPFLTEAIGASAQIANKMIDRISSYTGAGANIKNSFLQLLEGSRVDFPTIWQGSNYSPQYQLTCRLYNPDPSNPKMYKKFILTPLAYILAFACPTADSKYTYTFPLMIKARAAGLFYLPAGYISSVQVVKGGDSMDLTYQQQPGMIDIRLSIDSLYETMIATRSGGEGSDVEGSEDVEKDLDRPTLKKYFGNLWDWMDFKKLGLDGERETQPLGEQLSFDAVAGPLESNLLTDVTSRVGSAVSGIADVLGGVGNTLGGIMDGITAPINTILSTAGEAMNAITETVDGMFFAVDDAMSQVAGGVNGIINGITRPITGVVNTYNDLVYGGMYAFASISNNISNITSRNRLLSYIDLSGVDELMSALSGVTGAPTSIQNMGVCQVMGAVIPITSQTSYFGNTPSIQLSGCINIANVFSASGAISISPVNQIMNTVSQVYQNVTGTINAVSQLIDFCMTNVSNIAENTLYNTTEMLSWPTDPTVISVTGSFGDIIASMDVTISSEDIENIRTTTSESIAQIANLAASGIIAINNFHDFLVTGEESITSQLTNVLDEVSNITLSAAPLSYDVCGQMRDLINNPGELPEIDLRNQISTLGSNLVTNLQEFLSQTNTALATLSDNSAALEAISNSLEENNQITASLMMGYSNGIRAQIQAIDDCLNTVRDAIASATEASFSI